MDYSVLSDFEINKLVTQKELTNILNMDRATATAVEIIFTNGQISIRDYCNSWADMGQIIERESISILFDDKGMAGAVMSVSELIWDKKPTRAAAIAYLMMGDE